MNVGVEFVGEEVGLLVKKVGVAEVSWRSGYEDGGYEMELAVGSYFHSVMITAFGSNGTAG